MSHFSEISLFIVLNAKRMMYFLSLNNETSSLFWMEFVVVLWAGVAFVDVFFIFSSFFGTVVLYEKYLKFFKSRATHRSWILYHAGYALKRICRIFPLLGILGCLLSFMTAEQRICRIFPLLGFLGCLRSFSAEQRIMLYWHMTSQFGRLLRSWQANTYYDLAPILCLGTSNYFTQCTASRIESG